MKQIVSLVALAFAMSLMTFSQMACQPAPDTNRSESTTAPNTNSAREIVDTAAIEAELLRIENDWPRVVKEKDVAAMRRVEADDAVFVYPDGSAGSKDQDIKDIGSGALSAESIEMMDLKVNVIDNDTAIVTGRNRVKGGKYKMPDGKTMDISGEYRFIDTFVKRNGEWKLVAGASAKIMQPEASPAATASPAMKASPRATSSPAAKAPAATSTPVTRTTPEY